MSPHQVFLQIYFSHPGFFLLFLRLRLLTIKGQELISSGISQLFAVSPHL